MPTALPHEIKDTGPTVERGRDVGLPSKGRNTAEGSQLGCKGALFKLNAHGVIAVTIAS